MNTTQDVRLDFAARTDIGLHRQVNEDAVLAAPPCFLVADGMGGHEAGDIASLAAIRAFADVLPYGAEASLATVNEALQTTRTAVRRISAAAARGAGCTLTGIVLLEHEGVPHWLILNIGDSRVYLHRGSELQQLTVDHSLRDELLAAGTEESMLPARNIITRALGSADSNADTWLLPVETGARLLVCSDGLTTEVADEDLRACLTMGGRAEAVAEELVERAKEAGGRDNISIIVVDVLAGGRNWHTGGGSSQSVSLMDDTLEDTEPGAGHSQGESESAGAEGARGAEGADAEGAGDAGGGDGREPGAEIRGSR